MKVPRTVSALALFAWGMAAQPAPQSVDKVFAQWDNTRSPGCALAAIKGGRMVYERGFGMADLDHDIRITPSTVFDVGSISKQFTAAAVFLLAQEGKLSLDDNVRKYVPEVPDFGQRITLRHLIHHTSGLRDQIEMLELAGWRYPLDLVTNNDVLEMVSHQKELNFSPGEKHLYSNTGYTLLANVVSRVSGQSFRQFTAARIFVPLGMNSTHFREDHAEIVKNQAYGYEPKGETFRLSVPNVDIVGATSLLTSVQDLALWDRNFYEFRVGGKALVDQLLQRGELNNGEQLQYAFGLELGKYRGLPTVEHSGADGGYRADMLRFPEQHFSVVCLCNVPAQPMQLARRVADIYLADELKEPAPERQPPKPLIKQMQLAPEKLSEYIGIYTSDEMEALWRIVVQGGNLVLKRLKSSPAPIALVGPDEFRISLGRLRFTRNAEGRVSGMVLDASGVKNFRLHLQQPLQ
jgi:CubicO group peptidase (beta-lactamase class C family)